MRRHNTFHRTAGVLSDYDLRPGAEFIGGTIPRAAPVIMRDQLDRLAGGSGIIHMTLSLPEGFEASREAWLAIIIDQLEEMGIPPMRTAWLAARHRNTVCDHIHAAIVLRTFDGTTLRPKTGDRKTSRDHQTLARRLGLSIPEYFDPEIPQLAPPVITRRLDNKAKKRLDATLRRIFVEDRPQTLEEFDRALARQSPAIERVPSKNAHGVDSHLFRLDGEQIFGGELGPGWEPRHLRSRLAFCHALNRLRLRLSTYAILAQLLPYVKILKDLNNAKRENHPENAARMGSAAADTTGHRRQGRPAAPAARAPERPRTFDVRTWPGADRRASADLRGLAGSLEPSFGASGSLGTSKQDQRGNVADPHGSAAGTTGNEAGKPNVGGQDIGYSRPDVHDRRLTFGARLSVVLHLLRNGFQGWRWRRTASADIRITFHDGSTASLLGSDLRVSDTGLEAQHFEEVWHEAHRVRSQRTVVYNDVNP